jgi:peptide/nickel transport system permease protein
MQDMRMSAAQRDDLRAAWGFDQPAWRQYFTWAGNFLSGDMGWSYSRHQNVSDLLAAAVPRTLLLMAPGVLLGALLGVLVGTWQGANRGRLASRIVDKLTLVLVSIPDFVIVLLVLMVFAFNLRLFPAGNITSVMHNSMSWIGRVGDIAAHMVLPVSTLAVLVGASISRYHRIAIEGVMHEEFIRTARSKGATDRRVVYGHALRNALGPVITIGGLLLPTVFTGAVFIEKIFSWKGIGYELVNAVANRDYFVVQAIVVVGTVMVAIGAVVSDMLAAAANPRIALDA